jgi:hypothetical protein
VDPVTKLSDSQTLDYSLTLKDPAPGEHTVAVRATGDFDNVAVEKVICCCPADCRRSSNADALCLKCRGAIGGKRISNVALNSQISFRNPPLSVKL